MIDLTAAATLLLAGALLYLAGIGVGLWLTSPGKDRDSHTEAEIAEEAEDYLRRSDATYMHHIREVRRHAND